MLHVAERAVIVMRSGVRILLAILSFFRNDFLIVALKTCLRVWEGGLFQIRPVADLTLNAFLDMSVCAEIFSLSYGKTKEGRKRKDESSKEAFFHIYELPFARELSVTNYLATFWPAILPLTMPSVVAFDPKRTAPCTPPVASPAA